MASVAQLVEHRTVDAAVAGSSPVACPNKKTGLKAGFLVNTQDAGPYTHSTKNYFEFRIPHPQIL
jgi:hypothetical protein